MLTPAAPERLQMKTWKSLKKRTEHWLTVEVKVKRFHLPSFEARVAFSLRGRLTQQIIWQNLNHLILLSAAASQIFPTHYSKQTSIIPAMH